MYSVNINIYIIRLLLIYSVDIIID